MNKTGKKSLPSRSLPLSEGSVCVHAKSLQSCPTLHSMHCSPPGSSQEYWNGLPFSLLQGIFLTQGSNPRLLCLVHWQVGSLLLPPPKRERLNKTNTILCVMGGNANVKKITRERIQEASRVRVQFNTRWTGRVKFPPSFIHILAHTQTLPAFEGFRRPSIPSTAPLFLFLSGLEKPRGWL